MVFQVYRNRKTASNMAMGKSKFGRAPGKSTRVLQFALTFLTTALAVSVVGTAGHVFHTYKSQSSAKNVWWLPLWPHHFDTKGTKVAIGTGAGIVLLNIAFVVVAFLPKLNLAGRPKLSAITVLGIGAGSILLAIASIVVSTLLDTRTSTQDTIRTWTCQFRSNRATTPVSSDMTNGSFENLCTESLYYSYAMVAILVLQAVFLVTAVPQWITNRSIRPDSADGLDFGGKGDGY